ncbi:polysaccharide pyruvyl transferase family protein [Microbacterium sp. B2969]|uniref:Polysaccharide pyruvyl transferase family protein n=1 Tax=Microbacterium alkaliflavum TaxID=3248839 RepID=A0ABW7QB75_9MICO
MRLIEYDAAALTPGEWRAGGLVRAFNPTIAAVPGGYAIAYRVVHVDSHHRRIAAALLDHDFALVPGSVTPLSDQISFADPGLDERARTWHADPIYLRLKGRLYLMWNDGAARPSNHQFIAEMTDDGRHTVGEAREITTRDRRSLEKNWTLFESDGEVYASYSYRPHRVLRVDLDAPGPIVVAAPAFTSGFTSNYEKVFGVLRGGAQPFQVDGSLLAMAHSSFKVPEGRVYRAALIEFEGKPPFRVRRMSRAPFDLPSRAGTDFAHDKLNPDVHDVVYPRGLVRSDAGEWIVSYGLNDERCALAVMSPTQVEESLGPPVRTGYSHRSDDRPLQPLPRSPRPDVSEQPSLPVFWFDAKGKLFDGFVGGRRFATGNFGDIASRWAARRMSGVELRTPLPGEPRMLAIGSVLQRAQDGDVVWGAGVKGGSEPLPRGIDLDVRAVRGPLSIDYLHRAGVSTDRVGQLFDPGVLFPRLFADELEKVEPRGGDRIVPHYHDDLLLRRRHYEHLGSFVSVDTTPLGMMRALKGADRVFASSLHGVIFAEAMGIPAYWLAPIGGEDELKYHDYYLGTGRTKIKRFESLEEAMASDPMPLPRFDIDAYLETFPHDSIPRLSVRAVTPGHGFDFKNWDRQHLSRYFGLAGFGVRDERGIWMTSRRAAITTTVRTTPGEAFEATLTFAPTNPGTLPEPQTLRAQANGGPIQVVRWRRAGADRVEVTLEFSAHSTETALQIDLEARHLVRHPAAQSSILGRAATRLGAADTSALLGRTLSRGGEALGTHAYRGGVLSGLRIASLGRRA